MASGSGSGKVPDLPRGLIDRRGAPAGKAARLQSLRGPRDLTLGGVPKKVFAPNIPVRKEKNAREESKVSEEGRQSSNKSRDKSARGRGRGQNGRRGRGRGRGEENLVQIQSVFEQGPFVQKVKASSWDDGFGGGGGGGGRGGGRGGGNKGSSVRKSDLSHHVSEKASRSLEDMLRDNFLVDGPEEDLTMLPVMLPKCSSALVTAEVKKQDPEEVTGSTAIKEEPVEMDDSPSSSNTVVCDSLPSGRSTPDSDDVTSAQFLKKAARSEKEELLFIQLPNVLPGFPAVEEDSATQEGTSKDNKSNKENTNKPVKSSLRDFSEGYLGKLQVRKSGKVELVLGGVVLDVSMGVPSSFLQDVVSVRTDEGQRNMTVLGHVKQKMIITPNFESLLKTKEAENS